MGKRVVIVGAGLAGLTCARELGLRGVECIVLEAADAVGGRVRTDFVAGFPLDRGFQVLLTAYPETIRWLDYEKLGLQRFYAGAVSYFDGELHRLADPWRHPIDALATLHGPVGSLLDKLRIGLMRMRLTLGSAERFFTAAETTTAARLAEMGYSPDMVRKFLRPFFGGVFLDGDLETTSFMLDFTFRMFAAGSVAVPARGMGEIPHQLASGLPPGSIRTHTTVAAVEPNAVVTTDGERFAADAVAVATSARVAAELLGQTAPRPGRGVRCVYFRAENAPTDPYTLVLNGEGAGPVNNLCVRPGLAEANGFLVSATILEPYPADESAAVAATRSQLNDWFGDVVRDWEFLRAYEIRDALPDQCVGALDPLHEQPRLENGICVCGDYRQVGSINGAMASGRHAAEAIVAQLAP